MKKTIALSLLALAALGCSKEIPTSVTTTEEHPLVPMTFTAEIENTKALIDGVKTTWIAGDQISVSKLTPSTKVTDAPVLTAQTSGTSTTFTGTAPEGLETYYAFYPASAVTSWNANNSSGGIAAAFTSVKGIQVVECIGTDSDGKNVYIDPAVMFMAATAGSDLKFTFMHVGAYIKFEIPEGGSKVLTVTLNDAASDGATGQTAIAGGCNFNGMKNWSCGFSGGGKSIALKYTEGGTTNKRLPAGIYYMAVRPSKEMKCARFNFMDNTGTKHVYKCKDAAVTFAPGTVYSIGIIPLDLFD